MRRPTLRSLLPVLVAVGVAVGIGLAHPWDFGSTTGTSGAASLADSGTAATDAASVAAAPAGPADTAIAGGDPTTGSRVAAVPETLPPLGTGSVDGIGAPAAIAQAINALPGATDRRRLQNDLVPADPATLTGYVWPLPHGRITLPFGASPFGTWIVDGEPFHDGVDLATFCGDRIVAAHAGTVLAAGRRFDAFLGWVGDLGPYVARMDAKNLWFELPIAVVVDDGNTYRSVYAHFWKVVVRAGQHVRAGQLLGYEGRTGNASGCHLHYGLFSPYESATYATDPGTIKRMKLPALETARIDPLLVLPSRTSPPPAEPPAAEHLPPDLTE